MDWILGCDNSHVLTVCHTCH